MCIYGVWRLMDVARFGPNFEHRPACHVTQFLAESESVGLIEFVRGNSKFYNQVLNTPVFVEFAIRKHSGKITSKDITP